MLAFAITVVMAATSVAQVASPRPSGWVSDGAHVLDAERAQQINALAERLHADRGIELAVVTVDDVVGTPKQFATALFNRWGIGSAQTHTGLLVLLVMGQRRLEIETGRGMEAALPASWLADMQAATMVPRFKARDFGGGLLAGITAIDEHLRAAPGESTSTAAPGTYVSSGADGTRETARYEIVAASDANGTPRQVAASDANGTPRQVAASDANGTPRQVAASDANGTPRQVAASDANGTPRQVAASDANGTPRQVAASDVPAAASDVPAPASDAAPSAPVATASAGVPTGTLVGGGAAAAGGLGGLALLVRGRRRRRICFTCQPPREMTALDEARDDAHLDAGQRSEERVGSVDYEVLVCGGCQASRTLRHGRWFSGYSTCSGCSYKTGTSSSTTTVSATYDSGGEVEVVERCAHCNRHHRYTRSTPRLTRPSESSSSSSSSGSSSSSSSSSSSGYSGGSSSGGGAGSSW